MILTSGPSAMSWKLNGPEMFRALATRAPMSRARYCRYGDSVCGGNTNVASPEWTPACSTCSDTACARTTPLRATPSNSISWALVMNLVMTTGCSGDTAVACCKYCSSDSSSVATFMAAPLST